MIGKLQVGQPLSNRVCEDVRMRTVMLEFGIEKGSHFLGAEAWPGAAPFPGSAKLTHTENTREPSFWSKKTRNRPLGLA
jgi:hypothetical protein